MAEDLTDTNGEFSIPKYWTWFKHYQMAVYKKGYVCWHSNKIFPSFEERRDFKLKNGMIVKLERFKEEYSKEKHALYTSISAIHRPMPGIFDNAIRSELDLLYKNQRKKKEKKKNAPRALRAVSNDGIIILRWHPPKNNVFGYLVYRALPEEEFEQLNTQPIEDTFYEDTNVIIGQYYIYRVSAIDSEGYESTLSNAFGAEASDTQEPFKGY